MQVCNSTPPPLFKFMPFRLPFFPEKYEETIVETCKSPQRFGLHASDSDQPWGGASAQSKSGCRARLCDCKLSRFALTREPNQLFSNGCGLESPATHRYTVPVSMAAEYSIPATGMPPYFRLDPPLLPSPPTRACSPPQGIHQASRLPQPVSGLDPAFR